jgi:hypothetical protein
VVANSEEISRGRIFILIRLRQLARRENVRPRSAMIARPGI